MDRFERVGDGLDLPDAAGRILKPGGGNKLLAQCGTFGVVFGELFQLGVQPFGQEIFDQRTQLRLTFGQCIDMALPLKCVIKRPRFDVR
jgi:hypothetical protein